jgi:hypothetical protein
MRSLNSQVANYSLSSGQLSDQIVEKNGLVVAFGLKESSLWDLKKMLGPNEYQYRDEDFCIFYDFPHPKVIFPFLDSHVTSCSCTVIWLIRMHNSYSLYLSSLGQVGDSWEQAANKSQMLYDKCSKNATLTSACLDETLIDAKKAACELSGRVQHNWEYNTENGRTSLDIGELKYTFVVIMTPIACALGLLLNLKTVWSIWSKKKQENCYVLMSINSKFNCIYCLIYLLNLVSVCVDPLGLFCSAVFSSSSTQYFKIVAIGECVKVCEHCLLAHDTQSLHDNGEKPRVVVQENQ